MATVRISGFPRSSCAAVAFRPGSHDYRDAASRCSAMDWRS